ncbi:MAG: hypothetical protein KHX06_09575, partial [Brachyspira sp.]|nr:hypothetical protein [Brachyspira sp.]
EQNRTEHYYYLLNNNLNFYILQISKAFKFLSASILLQKFFSNKKLIFELSQFNQNFNFARNIYLNVFNKYQKESSIMKEQIKNFYLLLIILSLIALFLISCDNKNKTGTEGRTLSYYAGNWWGKASGETAEENILTINGDSSITLKIGDEIIIPSTSVTRVSDTNYIASYYNSTVNVSTKFTFNFSSDTQGKLIMEITQGSTSQSSTIDITKK